MNNYLTEITKEREKQIKRMRKMVKVYPGKVVGILNGKKGKRVMLLYKNKLKLKYNKGILCKNEILWKNYV